MILCRARISLNAPQQTLSFAQHLQSALINNEAHEDINTQCYVTMLDNI